MIRKEMTTGISGKVPLQPYTSDELAAFYGITTKTFLRWLVPFKPSIGEKIGWFYNIKQVETIFDNLGRPEKQD